MITLEKAQSLSLRDIEAIAELFYMSIMQGAERAYTHAQRQAWAGPHPDPARWPDRLKNQHCWLARDPVQPVGFMTLTPEGHIDLAFAHPDYIGQAIAFKLYTALEAYARTLGLGTLTSDASHLAKPFFERQGWDVLTPQNVSVKGVELTNFKMKKSL